MKPQFYYQQNNGVVGEVFSYLKLYLFFLIPVFMINRLIFRYKRGSE